MGSGTLQTQLDQNSTGFLGENVFFDYILSRNILYYIQSLINYSIKLISFSAYECDWAIKDNQRTWKHNLNSPILAKRDLKYGILKRFFRRQKKNFNKLLKKI